MKVSEEILGRATLAAMLATGLLFMMLPVWLMVTILRGIIEGVDWPRELGALLVGSAAWMLLMVAFAVFASWGLSHETPQEEAPQSESEHHTFLGTEPCEARIRASVQLYHRPF